MKPGNLKFATNNTYAAGPDVGSPTKIDGTDHPLGFVKDEKVTPDQFNFYRWKLVQSLDNLVKIRGKEFTKKDTSAIVSPAYSVLGVYELASTPEPFIDAGFETDQMTVFIGDQTATFTLDSWISMGGEYWDDVAPGGIGINFVPRDARYSSEGIVVGGASSLYTSVVTNTYVGWPGSGVANWNTFDNYNNAWCCFNATNGDVHRATSLGGALAVVENGCLSGAVWSCLRHSHHANNEPVYGDTGNPYWLLVIPSVVTPQVWGSSDGITWTQKAPAWTPNIFDSRSLDYSRINNRWGVICDNGVSSGGYETFAYSDDNGSTWTEVANAFNFNRGTGLPSGPGAGAVWWSRLVSDGYGHWLATFVGERNSIGVLTGVPSAYAFLNTFFSTDNGLTWEQVYVPGYDYIAAATGSVGIDSWFHDGAFWIAVAGYNGSIQVYDVYSSRRVFD